MQAFDKGNESGKGGLLESISSLKLRILYIVLLMFCNEMALFAANPEGLPDKLKGKNLDDCSQQLKNQDGGWCEISVSESHPSISSVWQTNLDKKIRMITGQKAILIAWNSAGFDKKRNKIYFMGGGHADYGGNEVYEFDLLSGQWTRLSDPTPLNYLFVGADYDARKGKPWRRLCWMPDGLQEPGITHTYDGLLFSKQTETLFYYSFGAASGSCFEDTKDQYRDNPIVIGNGKERGMGWFEFNPSRTEKRNGLLPIQWRKVFDYNTLVKNHVDQGYPASAELADGKIIFGSKYRTVLYDPLNPDPNKLIPFTNQADWGDGLKIFDNKRNLIWSIHQKSLLAFNGDRGNLETTYKQVVPHGKSIAIDKSGLLLSWNGSSDVFAFNPDEKNPTWKLFSWGANGPQGGDSRVYGKWVYLPSYDLFAGLSVHSTGVWIYKHPNIIKPISYASENLQMLLKRAKLGSKVKIPAGAYGQGLFIDRSMTIDLQSVSFRGVVNEKGIVNVNCDNCDVVIENLNADGILANCLHGNCAGIKAEGKGFRLKVKNARIKNTVIGILTDNRGGTLILEDSLIEDSGLNDKSSTLGHGFYAGDIDKLVVKNSIIRRSFGKGHIFKSRAPDTRIENSLLVGLDGRHSRVIDFPCGGKLVILNSVLQQGEQTDNIDLISVGTEPKNCGGSVHASDVIIKNNWLLFDRDESLDEPAANYGFNRIFTWRAPMINLDITDNRIVESTGRLKFDGEGKVPDLSEKNRIFSSRKAAGLGPKEVPSISIK